MITTMLSTNDRFIWALEREENESQSDAKRVESDSTGNL